MAVTMKDIARDCGVSVITVSKVLRNHADIGEKTRQRVLERVRELNYTPNLAARSLVTGRTDLVGLVVPDLEHSFFAQVAKSLSTELLKKGYCLIISTSNEDPDLEVRTINRLLARRLDALIIASTCSSPEHLKTVQRHGTPLILLDRNFENLSANFVGIDDELAGELATRHLIDAGCKRVAHLRGPETSPGRNRLRGYQNALAERGLKMPAGYISSQMSSDVHSRESGSALMRQMLRLKPRPDGIFAFNDAMAIGAIAEIVRSGLRVPEDVAVIGAGNLPLDEELRVPLSTIDQRTVEIGEQTAQLALTILDAKKAPRKRSIILEPQLLARASSARRQRRAALRA